MDAAWKEIARLNAANAVHRRGWRLGDAHPCLSIDHAEEELQELDADPDNIDELADVFGCLIVYAVKKGWTAEKVERAVLMKLAARFKETENA